MSETNQGPAPENIRDTTPTVRDDAFTLFDLRVEVIATDRPTPDSRHSDYEVSFDGAYVRPRASATPACAIVAAHRSSQPTHTAR
jgi:hypothetical protein